MKDPAVLFYTSDFLTGTFNLTNEQVGKYIRLICFQHQHGRIPPDDFERMTEGDHKIARKFNVDENGCFYNERLEVEIVKRSKFVESRRNNLHGNKKQHMNKHMLQHMDAHMENENININNNKGVPPKIEDVKAYCKERNNNVDAEKWYNFYEAKGWMIGKNKMKDWKAAVRTWENEIKPQKLKYE